MTPTDGQAQVSAPTSSRPWASVFQDSVAHRHISDGGVMIQRIEDGHIVQSRYAKNHLDTFSFQTLNNGLRAG